MGQALRAATYASAHVLAAFRRGGHGVAATLRRRRGTSPQRSIAQANKAMRLNADDFVT